MITDRKLGAIAMAVDGAMSDAPGANPATGWAHVEWLRLKADLLSRLAAAERSPVGALARRAELVRDEAERIADHLTGLSAAVEVTSAGYSHHWRQECRQATTAGPVIPAARATQPDADGRPAH